MSIRLDCLEGYLSSISKNRPVTQNELPSDVHVLAHTEEGRLPYVCICSVLKMNFLQMSTWPAHRGGAGLPHVCMSSPWHGVSFSQPSPKCHFLHFVRGVCPVSVASGGHFFLVERARYRSQVLVAGRILFFVLVVACFWLFLDLSLPSLVRMSSEPDSPDSPLMSEISSDTSSDSSLSAVRDLSCLSDNFFLFGCCYNFCYICNPSLSLSFVNVAIFVLFLLQLTDNSHSPSPDHSPSDPASVTPVVTIFTPHADDEEDEMLPPDSKRVRLSPDPSLDQSNSHSSNHSSDLMAVAAAAAASSNSAHNSLSNHEEHAVRQLITGKLQ